MNLYEHQSTYNPNMPVRFLIYLAEEYQKLVECAEQSIYGSCQIKLPTPQCVVFYNGEKDLPEEKILKLREALNAAIDYCLEHDILYDILREHRSEVLGMLLEEFDVDKYERTIRSEGVEQGIQQGIERANRLVYILLEQNRSEDLKRSLEDSEYQRKLFREFHL